MQTLIHLKRLHQYVLFALALMPVATNVYADCSSVTPQNLTFTGTTNITTTSVPAPFTEPCLQGRFTLDASGNIAILNVITENTSVITIPAVLGDLDGDGIISPTEVQIAADVRTNIRTLLPDSSNITAISSMNVTGTNDVVINNIGGLIKMSSFDDLLGTSKRVIGTFSADTNGLLFSDNGNGNGAERAGYASAISAGTEVPSLTINVSGITVSNQIISGLIDGRGDFSAAVFTNTPLLNINASNNGVLLGDVISYGTGTSVFNYNQGGGLDIYAVDRNPLLTKAQAIDPSLVLTYSQNDVGIRNSVMNFTGDGAGAGNIFLGSGRHVINVNALAVGDINVDQRDADIVSVTGGVATVDASIHGDRAFSLNVGLYDAFGQKVPSRVGNVSINDVVGSVNTINILSSFSGNFTANGLGVNTLNQTCPFELTPISQQGCVLSLGANDVTGFSTYTLSGSKFVLGSNINVTGEINLNAGIIELGTSILTAPRVVISNNTLLQTPGNAFVVGNLENNGTINLYNNTLNVDGNTSMSAGSKLQVNITPQSNGKIENTGIATFADNSTLIPEVRISDFGVNTNVRNGEIRTIANNVSGIPTVQNANILLQWVASESAGNLIITANIDVPDFLAPQITPAAKNVINALFSYTGDDKVFTGLQAQMIAQRESNLISAAERLHPEANDGAFRMVQGNADKFFGILESRLTANYLKATPDPMQVAAAAPVSQLGSANPVMSKGLWVQGFGDRGSQDGMNGFDGYASSSAGFAAGVDKSIDAAGDQRVGFAAAYTRGNVTNSGNTVNNRADINSFMAAAYGSWAMDDWYVNGMVGVGRNTYKTYRRLLEHAATGNHDSWQFTGRMDAGVPILLSETLMLIPLATLDYTHVSESSYSEKGKTTVKVLDPSGNQVIENGLPQFTQSDAPTNLEISSRYFDSLRAGIGVKAVYSLQEKDWGAELELHGLFRHEYGDLAQNTRARFVVGGNRFLSPGLQPERHSLLLGGSMRLTSDDEDDQLTMLISYDSELREKYFGQTMSLNVRYDFDQAPKYLKSVKEKVALEKSQKSFTNSNNAMQKANNNAPETITDVTVPDAKQLEIDQTIKMWITALSNKNLEVYFNSYGADFISADGNSRQQWERKRKNEIANATNLAFKVSHLTIKPNGNSALAMFTQTTLTDENQDSMTKILDLENKNGRWLIVREESITLND